MSVAAALAGIATRLGTITSPLPKRIYADPAEAVSLGDFPCVVLGLAPAVPHEWRRKGVGLGIHRFRVGIWVFVGSRQTPLPELHGRVLGWPEALADALAADMRLGGAADYIGSGQPTGPLFNYEIGPLEWSDGLYFGVYATLPVAQVKAQPAGV